MLLYPSNASLTADSTLLSHLDALLKSLRQNHNNLRKCNDRAVSLGVAMNERLDPVEEGIRLREERRLAERAQSGPSLAGIQGTGNGKEDALQGVGQNNL